MDCMEKINFIKNKYIACRKVEYTQYPKLSNERIQYHFYYEYDGKSAALMKGDKEDYDLVKKSKCIRIIKNLEELNVL